MQGLVRRQLGHEARDVLSSAGDQPTARADHDGLFDAELRAQALQLRCGRRGRALSQIEAMARALDCNSIPFGP